MDPAARRPGSVALLLGLVLLFVGVLGVAGAFLVYRATLKKRPSQIIVFHWIPGSDPLVVLGTPPFAGKVGAAMEREINPRLLSMLRDAGFTGELRIVGEFRLTELGRHIEGAILLRSAPKTPFTLSLVDSDTAIYRDLQPRFDVFPKSALPLGPTITLSPGKNAHVDLLMISGTNPNGQIPSGAMGLWWW